MDELLTLSRMARRLGVTQQWLREQADADEIPCLRAGKRYLFNSTAVEAALAAMAARGGDVDLEERSASSTVEIPDSGTTRHCGNRGNRSFPIMEIGAAAPVTSPQPTAVLDR